MSTSESNIWGGGSFNKDHLSRTSRNDGVHAWICLVSPDHVLSLAHPAFYRGWVLPVATKFAAGFLWSEIPDLICFFECKWHINVWSLGVCLALCTSFIILATRVYFLFCQKYYWSSVQSAGGKMKIWKGLVLTKYNLIGRKHCFGGDPWYTLITMASNETQLRSDSRYFHSNFP